MAEVHKNCPPWLKNSFFLQILQQNNSRQIRVKSFAAIPAVDAGNNYCSNLVRVKVQYEEENESRDISLIIKAPLADGKPKTMIDELGLMKKEYMMYSEFLPLLEKIINKKLSPTSYPCPLSDTLILVDLKEQGYIMCDRVEQLDLDHCLIFMKTIAIFHAASVYVNKLNPELIQHVGKELVFVDNYSELAWQLMIDGCHRLGSVIAEWGEFEQYANVFRNNPRKILDRCISLHKEKKHLLVLNHGDTWTNNMLFKYDNAGRVIDVKLVDFQMSKFASPALDLITFITTSAREDVKDGHIPTLYCTYLESLNSTFESLGCDQRLNSKELLDELEFAKCWYLCVLQMYMPTVLSDKDSAINLDVMLDSNPNKTDFDETNPLYRAIKGGKLKRVTKHIIHMLDKEQVLSSIT